jgi:DNA-binding CsgD family transcriptional regulator
LARGRNAAYIQQELSLTRNTVKSYVADVYRKLNVHSHQELIDLVEGER